MNRRFVVLSSGSLSWYSSEDATPATLKGTVNMVGASTKAARNQYSGSSGARSGFMITMPATTTPSGLPKDGEQLYFEAESQRDSDEWIEALEPFDTRLSEGMSEGRSGRSPGSISEIGQVMGGSI